MALSIDSFVIWLGNLSNSFISDADRKLVMGYVEMFEKEAEREVNQRREEWDRIDYERLKIKFENP